MIQGSPEWLAARCGKVTASRIADVVAKTKSGYSASRANYMAELIAERLTGQPAERYVNGAMQWGTEKEPEAREAYSFITGNDVREVGFIPHPTIEMTGASPDGLIGEDGGLELKCPGTAKHIETLLSLSGAIDGKYIMQVQWGMACAGRAWWDFCSFDPRLPPSMRTFIKRIHRDDECIAELEKEVRIFLSEVEKTKSQLQKIYGEAA